MSTGWYVYAIVARDTEVPAGLTGLGDGELSTVVWGSLAAVTSPLAPCGLRRTTENVLRHGAVVEGLQQRGPTLPVRFGTVVADAETLARTLSERHVELTADLARLGDKVEFGLTVLWDRPPGDDAARSNGPIDDDGPANSPGTRYLRARLAVSRRDAARQEAARTIARELDVALGSQVLDRRCSIAPTDRLAVRASFLIEPSRFGPCQQAIDAVRRRRPDLRVLLSGPWPPYSFVSRDRTDERSLLGQSLNDISRWLMPPSTDGEHGERSATPTRARRATIPTRAASTRRLYDGSQSVPPNQT
jgi:Gas vesicle synthesis protein GvpL/GvpF